MKYEKPEVAVFGAAAKAIQGVDKGILHLPDNKDQSLTATMNAYEADE